MSHLPTDTRSNSTSSPPSVSSLGRNAGDTPDDALSIAAAIVEHSADAIVGKDLDGIISFWNDAATKMYGYTADEAIGKPIEILIPEELWPEELEVRGQIQQGIPVPPHETVRRRKDRTLITVSFSTSPIKDRDENIVAAAGSARDITREVEQRNEAFEIEQRLEAIVESLHDAIVLKDVETGKILAWNPAATRMYGYTAEEAIGKPISILIPADCLSEELAIRQRIKHGAPVEKYRTQRRHKSGKTFVVSLSISPVKNAAGEIKAAAGSARNVSELEELQRQAAIMENAHDAIVLKDLETGRIIAWNPAATAMYGYTREEAIGRPIGMLIPDHLQDEDERIRQHIKDGITVPPRETIRRTKDGTLIDVSLSIAPLRDETGAIRWAARIARDISDKKKLEREKELAATLLAAVVNVCAHDFKKPMHNAKLCAEAAQGAAGANHVADSFLDEMLGQVVANAAWMTKLVEGLLAVATMESGRAQRRTTNVAEAFDETVTMLQSIDEVAHEADIQRGELPALRYSNHHLMCVVFQNLLTNACKYKRQDAPIAIRASARPYSGGWEFSIVDDGMGVDPELAERIFERFARDPTNERIEGLGVGLHFCRIIVEWHGGKIWVEPGPAGLGSAFKFTIPSTPHVQHG